MTNRINQSYQKMFPNNCAIIETTGDGVEVGTCTYHLKDGICPRHGYIDPRPPLTKEAAELLAQVLPKPREN